MNLKSSKKLKIFGLTDLLFSLLYLYFFIFVMPSYDPFLFAMTVILPLSLTISGIYMFFGFPKASEVAAGIAVLYLTVTLIILTVLGFTVGYFRGIYGPLGHGVTIISYIAMALVIEFLAVWPTIQLYAFRSTLGKNLKIVKKSQKKTSSVHKSVKTETQNTSNQKETQKQKTEETQKDPEITDNESKNKSESENK